MCFTATSNVIWPAVYDLLGRKKIQQTPKLSPLTCLPQIFHIAHNIAFKIFSQLKTGITRKQNYVLILSLHR